MLTTRGQRLVLLCLPEDKDLGVQVESVLEVVQRAVSRFFSNQCTIFLLGLLLSCTASQAQIRAAAGCFLPTDNSGFCLITEKNLRHGVLMPSDTDEKVDFLELFSDMIRVPTPSELEYFSFQSYNIYDSDYYASDWINQTF